MKPLRVVYLVNAPTWKEGVEKVRLGYGTLQGEEHKASFFSGKTAFQMVSYGVVGVYEWIAGYLVFSALPLPHLISFGIQSALVGFTAFLLRKYWTFAQA